MGPRRPGMQLGWLLLLLGGCTAAPIDVGQATGLRNYLFAHWSFDDAPGTTVHDDSGNFHEGTVDGATWTTGHFGGALAFDNGQQVQVPGFPSATPSWTVSTWSRLDQTQPGGTDYVTIVSTEIPLQGGWELNVIPTPGEMRYHFAFFVTQTPGTQNQNDYDYVECACVTPGVWTHVAAVIDGASMMMRLYVNGEPRQEAPIRHVIASGSNVLFMANWMQASTASRYFTGALDDVAIWDRALAPTEVKLLSTGPAPKS